MAESLRLGDHCEKIGSGATPRGGKETYSDDGPIALIRSQNVYNDRFSHGGLAFISDEQAAQLQNVEVKEGDVLLNITGDSVARACQVDPSVLPARVNQHVAIIRPRPDRIDPLFLRYFLVTPAMQAHMLGLAAAGATRNALTKSMIEGFRVPRLPVIQQTAIASVLGALDDKIDLNRRMNETLEAMARAIFKDWFVDFGPTRAKMAMRGEDPQKDNVARAPYLAPEIWSLFPDRLDDEGKPEGWEVSTIGNFIELLDHKRVPLSSQERAKRQGPYPYHGATSVMDHIDSYLFDEKLLLLGEDGSVAKADGRPFTQYVWGKLWVNNHAHVIKGRDVSVEQLKLFFDQIDIRPFVTGAVQPKLNQANLRRVPYLRAPQTIHLAFDTMIAPIYDLVRHQNEESRTLAAMRDLLLPKLMSGEIRVRDAEKHVGETF